MHSHLAHDIASAPIIKVGDYEFKAYSIGERGTTLNYELISEVVSELVSHIHPETIDSVVSIHVTGAMWALPVALMVKRPLHLFTTEPSNIPGQQVFEQARPYLPRLIYSPDLSKIGRCVIIDDVLSGGGTIRQMKSAIETAGGSVVAAICVIDKYGNASTLSEQLGIPVHVLARGS